MKKLSEEIRESSELSLVHITHVREQLAKLSNIDFCRKLNGVWLNDLLDHDIPKALIALEQAIHAAAQLAAEREAGPIVVELDQGPPVELGDYIVEHDPSYEPGEIPPPRRRSIVSLRDAADVRHATNRAYGYHNARWSRSLQIGGGE